MVGSMKQYPRGLMLRVLGLIGFGPLCPPNSKIFIAGLVQINFTSILKSEILVILFLLTFTLPLNVIVQEHQHRMQHEKYPQGFILSFFA